MCFFLNTSPIILSTQHAGRQAQHDARGGGEVDCQPHPQCQARRQDRLQAGEFLQTLIHLLSHELRTAEPNRNRTSLTRLLCGAAATSQCLCLLRENERAASKRKCCYTSCQSCWKSSACFSGSRGDGEQCSVSVPAGDWEDEEPLLPEPDVGDEHWEEGGPQ